MRYSIAWASLFLLLVAASVPWFFIPYGPEPFLLGLPYWVVHALGAMLLYAACTSAAIFLLWNRIANGAGEE